MKYFAFIFYFCFGVTIVAAQHSSALKLNTQYLHVRQFVTDFKKDSFAFTLEAWRPIEYQKQYAAALSISKQKEFYPVLLYDNRFVSHSLNSRYGTQSYIWVDQSPDYKNFKEALIGEFSSSVLQSIIGGKKKPANGYYTPLGTAF